MESNPVGLRITGAAASCKLNPASQGEESGSATA